MGKGAKSGLVQVQNPKGILHLALTKYHWVQIALLALLALRTCSKLNTTINTDGAKVAPKRLPLGGPTRNETARTTLRHRYLALDRRAGRAGCTIGPPAGNGPPRPLTRLGCARPSGRPNRVAVASLFFAAAVGQPRAQNREGSAVSHTEKYNVVFLQSVLTIASYGVKSCCSSREASRF